MSEHKSNNDKKDSSYFINAIWHAVHELDTANDTHYYKCSECDGEFISSNMVQYTYADKRLSQMLCRECYLNKLKRSELK